MDDLHVDETVRNVPEFMKLVGVIEPLDFKNGCCPDKSFAITAVKSENGFAYSCQCSCGMWCTNGHDNPVDAIAEYEMMCRGEHLCNDKNLYMKYKQIRRTQK